MRRSAKKLLHRLRANDYQTLNVIVLNRRSLLSNLNYFKELTGCEVIPVLKANAYGHGLEHVAGMLNGADCAFLAVDGYFEAAQIMHITHHPILVMGYIKPENVHLLNLRRCSFVIQDVASLHALARLNRPVRVHIELDTGMHRLGLSRNELTGYLEVLRQYPKLKLEGVMTHLADADNETSNTFTNDQAELFDASIDEILEAGFKPRYVHIAQTAGSPKVRSRCANTIRLGIGLYGINPLQPADRHFKRLAELKPVLCLKSTIIKTYDLKAGDRVSYNGIFTAPHTMRIGVLPLGYYEGVPRKLSNKGSVTSGQQQLPIVGRVCMNHTMIDISGTDLKTGDCVTVISDNRADPNSIQSVAFRHDIFVYTWLANLAASTRRVCR